MMSKHETHAQSGTPQRWFLVVLCALLINPIPPMASAIDDFADLEQISELPSSERELQLVFRTSRSQACEIVPGGEPLEIRSFTPFLTEKDRRSRNARPLPASRRNLMTVGLEFARSDRADLPLLSRGEIAGYVDEHYVSIQARVRRDLLDRKLYYHHRPIAVTGKYRGARLSQDFEPLVMNTVRDFHGLGLWVPNGKRRVHAEDLRTMVMVFRTPKLVGSRVTDIYELVFVRGREGSDTELEGHVFVTTDSRTKLNYLRSAGIPSSTRATSITGRIAITEFDSSGLYPRESATRDYSLSLRKEFPVSELNEFCRAKQLQGGYGDNLSRVLDAIIDGEL